MTCHYFNTQDPNAWKTQHRVASVKEVDTLAVPFVVAICDSQSQTHDGVPSVKELHIVATVENDVLHWVVPLNPLGLRATLSSCMLTRHITVCNKNWAVVSVLKIKYNNLIALSTFKKCQHLSLRSATTLSCEWGKVTSSSNKYCESFYMPHERCPKHFPFTNQQSYVALSCIIQTYAEEKVTC